jgi:hypothetical protein
MQAVFSLDDIELLKRELGVLLPAVKSSHRVEAMARGLGWQTNAALRTTLGNEAIERGVDDRAFTDYLKLRGFSEAPFDALSEAVVGCKFPHERAALQRVMAHEPRLARWGFGVHRDARQTREERLNEFEQNRAELCRAGGIAEFLRAREYLSYASHRRTVNYRVSSYGLKHGAEHYFRDRGLNNNYVSNGALIAAAIHLGFNYRADGPNAYFNMGRRHEEPLPHPTELGSSSSASPPRTTTLKLRQTAWRNMMIAGINAGLAQQQFGLAPDDNRWSGDHAIYTFSIADMPAIACVSDGGFGELFLRIAVNPTPDARRWISAINAGFEAGEAFTTGWLERRRGRWLQTTSRPQSSFRRHILPTLAKKSVEPDGYLPEGRFMM